MMFVIESGFHSKRKFAFQLWLALRLVLSLLENEPREVTKLCVDVLFHTSEPL